MKQLFIPSLTRMEMQVKLSHNEQRVRLSGFSPKSAKDLMFPMKEEGGSERQVSVQQYYAERYGIQLKHPGLPCVLSRNGAAFPIELCT